jgi:predicted TIM-barrel fold metal-dependent hydrolase
MDCEIVDAHFHVWRLADLPWLQGPPAGLPLLAREPHVAVKLSGQGAFVHRVDAALSGLVAATALELFGADRLFGSNFPIESLWTGYRSLVETWRAALAPLPAHEREAVFAGTARRIYSL